MLSMTCANLARHDQMHAAHVCREPDGWCRQMTSDRAISKSHAVHSIWHASLHAAVRAANCLGYSFIDISSTSVRLSIVKFLLLQLQCGRTAALHHQLSATITAFIQ
jgi:hypothetical protein